MTDRDKVTVLAEVYLRHKANGYAIVQLNTKLRLWTEMCMMMSGHATSRVISERLLDPDRASHTPLECLFFGWQPVQNTFYRVIPQPGDPAAYNVPDYELEALFTQESDRHQQPRQWVATPNVCLACLLIDDEIADELHKINPVLAPVQANNSYLAAANKLGFRIMCRACVQTHCQLVAHAQ